MKMDRWKQLQADIRQSTERNTKLLLILHLIDCIKHDEQRNARLVAALEENAAFAEANAKGSFGYEKTAWEAHAKRARAAIVENEK